MMADILIYGFKTALPVLVARGKFIGMEGAEEGMWRLVDGNYGGATQIYGQIRQGPKHKMRHAN